MQDTPQLKSNSAPSLVLNSELRAQKINDIKNDEKIRLKTNMQELDRVLGGGFVAGSLVLLADFLVIFNVINFLCTKLRVQNKTWRTI